LTTLKRTLRTLAASKGLNGVQLGVNSADNSL
jgi:hypothetical protein